MKPPANLLAHIKREFPHLRWRKAVYAKPGFDFEVVILDDRDVVRFPKQASYRRILKQEIGVMPIIQKSISLPIPVYTAASRNFSSAVYPIVPGKALSLRTYKSLSPARQARLAKHLAIFLSELHSIPAATLKGRSIPVLSPARELRSLKSIVGKYLHQGLDDKNKKWLGQFFSHADAALKATIKTTLVHRDLGLGHILIDSSGSLSGIIDFSDRAFYDAAFDFLFLWELGEKFVAAVYTHYQGKKDGLLERSKIYAGMRVLWHLSQAVSSKDTEQHRFWEKQLRIVQKY